MQSYQVSYKISDRSQELQFEVGLGKYGVIQALLPNNSVTHNHRSVVVVEEENMCFIFLYFHHPLFIKG